MGLILPGAIGAVGVVTALQLYARYAGEHPVLDAAYDWKLRRIDLQALDRRACHARRRSDLVITLTTLPSRIDRIAPTIKSLLNQTRAAAAIRIHVPRQSRREDVPYLIPAWLANLASVTVVRCDDYGPATKLIPALAGADGDQRLLVVDDDRVYHPWLVEQMTVLSDAHPDMAIAASGWDAPPDRVDRQTRLSATLLGRPPAPIKCTRVRGLRDVDIMQGFSGYVVRPRFFDREAVADYSAAPPAAFFVDDVWISAHCQARKVVAAGRRTNFPSWADARFFKRSSVALVNRGDGSPASRNNTVMLKFFDDRWRGR